MIRRQRQDQAPVCPLICIMLTFFYNHNARCNKLLDIHCVCIVNDKLALVKSICQLLNNNMGICHPASAETGLPWWLRQGRIHLQCRRPGFDPWVGKIRWRRERLPIPGFCSWTEEPGRLQSTGSQRVEHN